MTNKAPSIEAIIDALPAVQAAVREEISVRIAAGEMVAGIDESRTVRRGRRSLDFLQMMLDDDRKAVSVIDDPIARRPSAA